jgi:hypothetical protein
MARWQKVLQDLPVASLNGNRETEGHFKADNYSLEAGNGFLEYNGRIESLTYVFIKHLKINESEL